MYNQYKNLNCVYISLLYILCLSDLAPKAAQAREYLEAGYPQYMNKYVYSVFSSNVSVSNAVYEY